MGMGDYATINEICAALFEWCNSATINAILATFQSFDGVETYVTITTLLQGIFCKIVNLTNNACS